jgi:(2Fe-2S) ferredoxin
LVLFFKKEHAFLSGRADAMEQIHDARSPFSASHLVSGCLDRCALRPCETGYKQRIWYGIEMKTYVERILGDRLTGGRPMADLLLPP